MSASAAKASVGNRVSAQRWEPSAERFIAASRSGLRAFCARARLAGAARESERVLASAMIAMRTSESVYVQRCGGGAEAGGVAPGRAVEGGGAPRRAGLEKGGAPGPPGPPL